MWMFSTQIVPTKFGIKTNLIKQLIMFGANSSQNSFWKYLIIYFDTYCIFTNSYTCFFIYIAVLYVYKIHPCAALENRTDLCDLRWGQTCTLHNIIPTMHSFLSDDRVWMDFDFPFLLFGSCLKPLSHMHTVPQSQSYRCYFNEDLAACLCSCCQVGISILDDFWCCAE